MSMTINNQEDFHRVQRLVWGKVFGLYPEGPRETWMRGGGTGLPGRHGIV